MKIFQIQNKKFLILYGIIKMMEKRSYKKLPQEWKYKGKMYDLDELLQVARRFSSKIKKGALKYRLYTWKNAERAVETPYRASPDGLNYRDSGVATDRESNNIPGDRKSKLKVMEEEWNKKYLKT